MSCFSALHSDNYVFEHNKNNEQRLYSNIMNNYNNNVNQGLYLILGPMFSQKTTTLINIYNKISNEDNVNTYIINYIGDKRYGNSGLISHDNVKVDCIFTDKIKEIYNHISIDDTDKNILFINEIQFFSDTETIIQLLNDDFTIICSGLSGDFKINEFKTVSSLIPYSTDIIMNYAVCTNCHGKASYSYRNDVSVEQVVIGGSDKYTPLCYKCYQSKQ